MPSTGFNEPGYKDMLVVLHCYKVGRGLERSHYKMLTPPRFDDANWFDRTLTPGFTFFPIKYHQINQAR